MIIDPLEQLISADKSIAMTAMEITAGCMSPKQRRPKRAILAQMDALKNLDRGNQNDKSSK
jgi:hypothetical protein